MFVERSRIKSHEIKSWLAFVSMIQPESMGTEREREREIEDAEWVGVDNEDHGKQEKVRVRTIEQKLTV